MIQLIKIVRVLMAAVVAASLMSFITPAPVVASTQIGLNNCVPTAVARGLTSLRRGPGVRWPRLATLNIGDTAQITGRLNNNTWYQVLFNNQPGWVFSQFVVPSCNGAVPVVPPLPVPQMTNTANFRANPTIIAPSQCSTLSWNVNNVASVYFVEGNNAKGVAGNSSKVVCPTATTQYSLLVTRRDNSSFNSVVVVTVAAPTPIPLDTANFRANPTTIAPGQCSTLSWNIDNVAAVYFKENGNSTGVPGNSSKVVCPQQTTQYGLLVQRRDNTTFFGVVIVTVAATSQLNFRADAGTINAGQCTTLRWNIDNVTAVFLITGGNVQGVPGNYSQQVCPPNTTSYVLRVQRRDNSTFDTPLTIVVNNGTTQPNFRADNTTINRGQCTTLHWDVDNIRGIWF